MSQSPSTTELTRLRAAYAESLQDACKLGTTTENTASTYSSKADYTYGSEIACGFADVPVGESDNGAEAPVIDAKVRLPHGTTVTTRHRIKITKRWGSSVTEYEYAVVKPPHVGPAGVVVDVSLVTGKTPK